MIDLRSLATWIQPQHLEETTLAQYAASFAAHPGRLLIVPDFLATQAAERLNRFLATEAEFKPEYGTYSKEGAVSESEWNSSQESDRFFRLRKLVATPPRFQMSPNALTYLQFRRAFQRPEMKAFFEAVSSMSLGWSDDFGAHCMIEGDFLRPHSDDNRDRRLALVIYLSPGWRREYGGQLRVAHPEEGFTEVAPTYNSLIAFDVLASPAHLVLPITAAAGAWQRLSIGGWYHKTVSPGAAPEV